MFWGAQKKSPTLVEDLLGGRCTDIFLSLSEQRKGTWRERARFGEGAALKQPMVRPAKVHVSQVQVDSVEDTYHLA